MIAAVAQAGPVLVVVLQRHGFAPDRREKAAPRVLQQNELIAEGWAA